MRRKDRAMDEAFGYEVLARGAFMTLAFQKEGHLLQRPLSYVLWNGALYVHGATEGEKIALWTPGLPVSLAVVADIRIPDHVRDADLAAVSETPAQLAKLASQVFTTEYASVLAEGRIYPVMEEAEARGALLALAAKYVPERLAYAEAAIAASLARTAVHRIELSSLSAKRKKYDRHGQEMKWQRRQDT